MLKYMRTPPTHYFLESNERASYMKIHPKYVRWISWCMSIVVPWNIRVIENIVSLSLGGVT